MPRSLVANVREVAQAAKIIQDKDKKMSFEDAVGLVLDIKKVFNAEPPDTPSSVKEPEPEPAPEPAPEDAAPTKK